MVIGKIFILVMVTRNFKSNKFRREIGKYMQLNISITHSHIYANTLIYRHTHTHEHTVPTERRINTLIDAQKDMYIQTNVAEAERNFGEMDRVMLAVREQKGK